jgi:hypothetical protein
LKVWQIATLPQGECSSDECKRIAGAVRSMALPMIAMLEQFRYQHTKKDTVE